MVANDFIVGKKSARSRVGLCIMCIHQGSLKATYITAVTFKAKHCRRYLNNGSQLRFSHLFIRNIQFRFKQCIRITRLMITHNIVLLHRILVSS